MISSLYKGGAVYYWNRGQASERVRGQCDTLHSESAGPPSCSRSMPSSPSHDRPQFRVKDIRHLLRPRLRLSATSGRRAGLRRLKEEINRDRGLRDVRAPCRLDPTERGPSSLARLSKAVKARAWKMHEFDEFRGLLTIERNL